MDMKIATLALIVRDGKLLLGLKKRTAEIGGNTLNGPGGKVHEGESIHACVVRETKEEVGLDIHPSAADERAVITFHNGTTSVWRVHVFLITVFDGEPTATEEMHPIGDWWYDCNRLPFATRMLASDFAWMPQVLAGERFEADVYQNDDATIFDRIEPSIAA